MALFGEQMEYTVRAAADLRERQYRIMRFSAANQTNVASDSGAASTAGPIGVLQNRPNSGQAARVTYLGESKLEAAAAITAGDWVTTNGCGQAVAAGSGDMVIARVQEASGAANDVVRALVFPPFRLIGTLT